MNNANEKESIKRIKRFLNIMDSMTTSELDGEGNTLTHPRIVRIARGSGTSIEEVHMLLEEYKKLGKVIGKLGKTSLGKGINYDRILGNELTNL